MHRSDAEAGGLPPFLKKHVNRKKALHKDNRRSRNHKKIWTNIEEFVKLEINLVIE